MTIQVAPITFSASGGGNSHTHGENDFDPLVVTVQNAKSGPRKDGLVAACAEVYTKSEIDKKVADISVKFEADFAAMTKAMKKELAKDVAAGFAEKSKALDITTTALFDALASAKAELLKALSESIREEIKRLVEVEVRRILPDLIEQAGGRP